MNAIDVNVAVVLVGLVLSVVAERLPGLAPYWHALSAGRKRAYVSLAAVIVGIVVTLAQGGELDVNGALSDLTRYTILAAGGLLGAHQLAKVDDAK